MSVLDTSLKGWGEPMHLSLSKAGLELRPAQVWGTVRIVPLVRPSPIDDLRIARRDYAESPVSMVDVGDRTTYTSYIPHGLVMGWSTDGGAAEVPVETLIGQRELRHQHRRKLVRTVRRESNNQLRLLPLHVAMEGFLALHFGGPDIAHHYYSSEVLRYGLSPRQEITRRGGGIVGLAEALRVFERHEGQCGALVFVGDSLASALVVAHPDDYLSLHQALVEDCFPELLYHYGWLHRRSPEFKVRLEGKTLDAIEASLNRQTSDWNALTATMAHGLFERDVHAEKMRTAGRYRLMRLLTGTDVTQAVQEGEHIGEMLVASGGEVAYLKTYRLDRGPIRRAKVLMTLAAFEWDLQAVADYEGHGHIRRVATDIERAGLGWILHAQLRAG